jgi:hypothetical protein
MSRQHLTIAINYSLTPTGRERFDKLFCNYSGPRIGVIIVGCRWLQNHPDHRIIIERKLD